ncbi:MAG TPA: 7TM diverse intracellular signaling domain-containing protein [Oligoflexus sp.]|uniref:7TM diverse intracellular signaling domain-containing protein n=1 Tax=Oligoflexus sp. TaxID=1971216 RepID=UPI002D598CDD|nr:7TM diverse intracellular signaling domain-containing protein [Oligoflexus sp.]HYX38805.1 7TM diverse intracellular signaling domain-containing protein [Oligoflexus sp.]
MRILLKRLINYARFLVFCLFALVGATRLDAESNHTHTRMGIPQDISDLLQTRAAGLSGEANGMLIESSLFWTFTDDKADLTAVLSRLKSTSIYSASQNQSYQRLASDNEKLWLLFAIDHQDQGEKDIVLEFRYPANRTALYQFHDGYLVKSERKGVYDQYSNPDDPYRYLAYRIHLKDGKNFFLMEVSTFLYASPIFIWNPIKFDQFRLQDYIFVSAIFASFFIIIIYNFLGFLISKNFINAIYVGYLSSITLYLFYIQGVGLQLLGQPFRTYMAQSCLLMTSMMFVGQTLFAIYFLNLNRMSRKLVRVLNVLNGFCLLLGITSFWAFKLSNVLIPVLFTIETPIILWAAVLAFKSGFKSAQYYLLSWSFMAVAVLVYCGSALSILPVDPATASIGLLVGTLIEMILLSLAINDKVNRSLKNQNFLIKQEQEKNAHAFSQMSKIVYPHQIESIKMGQSLEQTMPTGPGEACVINFDIIGSSKIQHVRAKDFLRNVFRRCNEVMLEGYDGKELKANAFRIKEMGDGFLCSVGYPFRSHSENIANDALALAFRFQEVLVEEAGILQSDNHICCGIGIALDTIAGFYPETGTKEYDLYGKAIILATRYEGMRKLIQQDHVHASIIIVQERVYQSFDREYRRQFIEIDLQKAGIVVRDDSAATRLYYKILDHDSSANNPSPYELKSA